MRESETEQANLRPVIEWTVVVCVAVAMAPWLSGGQEPVARVISGGALLVAVVMAWMQPSVRRLARGPLYIAFAALAGFSALSYLWSANRYSTVIWVATWLMAGLVFQMSYIVAGEQKGRDLLVAAYLWSALVFTLVAWEMFFSNSFSRLMGPFDWPNPAAAYLMPAILICLDRLRTTARSWLWGTGFVLFLCSFMLADSRGAGLVLLFFAGIYLLVVKETRRYWTQIVCTTILAIVLTVGVGWLANITGHHNAKIAPGSRLAEVVEGQSGSLRQRLQFTESAVEIWFAHPLGGVGAGAYALVHPEYQKTVVSASSDAHDVYVQVLAELGIIGAVLVAFVILFVLLGTARGLVDEPGMLAVAMGGAALLLHFAFDIDAQYPALLLLAACLFGLVWQGIRTDRAKSSWTGPAAALALMIPIASAYTASVHALRASAAQAAGDSVTAAEQYQAAHLGLTYDPSYINAEGINVYAIAATGQKGSGNAAALALALAHKAEGQSPYDGQNYQLEGRVLALEGHYSQAETAFRRALKLDPNDEPSYSLDLATVQYDMGDYAGAEVTAKAMLAKYPISVINDRLADGTLQLTIANLYAVTGDAYLKQGQIAEAGKQAKSGLGVDASSLSARALQHQVEKRSAEPAS